MGFEGVPLRYDLVHDLGSCLVDAGLLQQERSILGPFEVLQAGSWESAADLLLQRAGISRTQARQAWTSLNPIDLLPCPPWSGEFKLHPIAAILALHLRRVVETSGTALRLLESPRNSSYRVKGADYEMSGLSPEALEAIENLLTKIAPAGHLPTRAFERKADFTRRAPAQGELAFDVAYPTD